MDDNAIIDLLFERSEQAIGELDAKYGRTCHKISYNILGNRSDAEECVNDAYLGVWKAIPPLRPKPLFTYLCRIVRNISITRYHANTAAKRNSAYDIALDELEGCLCADRTVEDELEGRRLVGIIEEFLDTLSRDNRVIFMRRYWFCDSYADIARRVGIGEKAVSVRLTRIRGRLLSYLKEKEVSV